MVLILSGKQRYIFLVPWHLDTIPHISGHLGTIFSYSLVAGFLHFKRRKVAVGPAPLANKI